MPDVSSTKESLGFVESLQWLMIFIGCTIVLAVIIALVTAGAYIGWHDIGPWIDHAP
jgi:hypothetical protein